MDMMGGGMGNWMWLNVVLWIVVIAGIVALVVWAIQKISKK